MLLNKIKNLFNARKKKKAKEALLMNVKKSAYMLAVSFEKIAKERGWKGIQKKIYFQIYSQAYSHGFEAAAKIYKPEELENGTVD